MSDESNNIGSTQKGKYKKEADREVLYNFTYQLQYTNNHSYLYFKVKYRKNGCRYDA